MTTKINNTTGKYTCPQPMPNVLNKKCGNTKNNLILYECTVCEKPHKHLKCSLCEYEWGEM